MSVEENKKLIRDYFEKVVNPAKVDKIAEYLAPEYTELSAGQKRVIGIEGEMEHILGVKNTYPDLIIELNQLIAEGEWVVSCVTARGTHTGHWLGMRPTGKPVTITAVNVHHIVDGKIIAHRGAANTFEALLEIGAIQAVP